MFCFLFWGFFKDPIPRKIFFFKIISISVISWTMNFFHYLKSLMATRQECCKQYWTSPGGNTQQSSSCTATYHPSWKLSKLDEPDMQDTAGEVETSSKVMYSYGPLHMDEQKQDDQLKPTYSSSVRIRGVALRTCRKRWTIRRGGERESGISVLMARQDDDDDDFRV